VFFDFCSGHILFTDSVFFKGVQKTKKLASFGSFTGSKSGFAREDF